MLIYENSIPGLLLYFYLSQSQNTYVYIYVLVAVKFSQLNVPSSSFHCFHKKAPQLGSTNKNIREK